MKLFDAFISYASEEANTVSEIAGALKYKGFNIWYDRFVLKVGDRLLNCIEEGLNKSKHGIIFISKDYLKKGWTNYEMDILLRQSIENNKKILQIWHEVSKFDVEARHPGLVGIYALNSKLGLSILINELSKVLAEGIKTQGLIPSYESPIHRFLMGKGELHLGNNDGPAFNIFEAIIHFKDEDYPLAIEGEIYNREILVWDAAEALAQNSVYCKSILGIENFNKVWNLCKEYGVDPSILG